MKQKLLAQQLKKLAQAIGPENIFEFFKEPISVEQKNLADMYMLEQFLKFMNHLTAEELKLILCRASGTCWKRISRELNCHRTTAWYKQQKALSKICHRTTY